MANINRDYLIVLDAKSSVISDADDLKYYITDEHSQNLFINLVVRDTERINKYVEVHDPEKYQLELHIVKPNNDIVRPHLQASLLSAEDALYEFELPKEAVDYIGTYKCELRVTYKETDETTITTSNKFKYKVKCSIYNNLDSIQDAPQYPVVIQLLDKLSDINQYEEDRKANELARQLAEQQRQARFDALDADMMDSIQQMDDKVVEVENRITTKEQAVDKLIVDTKADINDYKVAKDHEIDDYKTTKDTEINNAITAQDNKINTAITTQNNIITQAIANQDTKIDTAITAQNNKIEAVQNNDSVQNNKLDTLQNKATIHEERITATEVKNTEQDNRLDIIENTNIQQNSRLTAIEDKNIEQDNRLNEIEAIDVAQNTRLDAIEAKNTEQDDRLLDIEKVNKKQDIDIKCLYGASQTIDVTEEGNSIYLQNSNNGFIIVDEIKGNTLVNCNKEPDKELILNGNINTSGDNAVTITEGVDGGLVDVALEGNTLVNVSKTKDSTATSKAYTVENSGNHTALPGNVDGKCRPVVTGNTLLEENENSRLQSSFENNLVTQEMVDSGKEVADNLGKYKVEYKVTGKNLYDINKLVVGYILGSNGELLTTGNTNLATIKLDVSNLQGCNITRSGGNRNDYRIEDNNKNLIGHGSKRTITIPTNASILYWYVSTNKNDSIQIEEGSTATSYEPYKGYTKTLYLNSPLLERDTIEEKGDSIYHVHRSELLSYTEGDETSLITDKVNTLHRLATPTYELIEQSNLAIPSYANGHLDFNTAVPVEKVDFLPFSEELTYLYANTQYTVQFIADKAITADITLGGTSLLAQSIVAGLNRISITTPATLVDNKLIISGVGANISEIVVTDTDREFKYFEGMKSVGECEGNIEVLSSNGNYANTENTKQSFPYSSSGITFSKNNLIYNIQGSTSSYPYIRIIEVGKLEPNTRYSFTCKGEGTGAVGIRLISRKYNNKLVIIPSGSTFTTPFDVRDDWGIDITVSPSENVDKTFSEIMIKKVENTMTYKPYALNTQQLTHEPLRAVGDAKDRYVLIDGKWYIERNCKEYTIPQDTIWTKTTIVSNNGKYTRYYFIMDNMITDQLNASNYGNFAISGLLPFGYSNSWGACNRNEIQIINNSTEFYVQLDKTTVEEVASLMNGSKIIYRLKKPTYEPIDYNPLEVYSDVTHISTNSAIPTNITVKNHGFNCLLKPSTTYTISSNLGLNTVTTPSTLTEDCLRFMDTDTSDVTTMRDVLVLEGDWTSKADLIPANFSGIESAFEQEYDAEKGKYKVNVKVANEDKTKENNITFYINEPLRGIGDVKDKVFIQDDKVIVQRNCGIRTYEDGDFGTYLTDKVNTVYPLAEPTYQEIEYNDTKLFIESFKNSTLSYNSNVPVTSKLYYSYSVPIVDTVAQTASISDEQDVMIIDLASQVAVMEMMLM